MDPWNDDIAYHFHTTLSVLSFLVSSLLLVASSVSPLVCTCVVKILAQQWLKGITQLLLAGFLNYFSHVRSQIIPEQRICGLLRIFSDCARNPTLKSCNSHMR